MKQKSCGKQSTVFHQPTVSLAQHTIALLYQQAMLFSSHHQQTAQDDANSSVAVADSYSRNCLRQLFKLRDKSHTRLSPSTRRLICPHCLAVVRPSRVKLVASYQAIESTCSKCKRRYRQTSMSRRQPTSRRGGDKAWLPGWVEVNLPDSYVVELDNANSTHDHDKPEGGGNDSKTV